MNNTLSKDLLLNMLLGLVALVVLVLPTINPPAVDAGTTEPPGQIIVSAAWPEGGIDVDLICKSPDDAKPVLYSRVSGRTFSLVRDDLGTSGDAMPMNFENCFGRGTPAGEYIVNLHCFRCSDEVPVAVEVRFGPIGQPAALFFSEVVTLVHGQERTAIRFRLDTGGKVVGGSVHKVYAPLRSAGK